MGKSLTSSLLFNILLFFSLLSEQETDLLVSGFPCVDVSSAGNRAGLEGEQTGLVRHVFRLLHAAKTDGRAVPWVLLENVEGVLHR